MAFEQIAIIDDSSAIRKAASAILRKEGYEVVEAVDGYEGIALLHKEKPDIAIIDVEMPKIGGLDLTRILHSNAASGLPVILLTSKNSLFDIQRGNLVGADLYLTKPFTPDSLLGAVRQLEHE